MHDIVRWLAHRWRTTRWSAGQATVEFVLVSLVLIPLVIGAIEIGRGVWYYNQVSQLAREGARWIIVTATDVHKTTNQFNLNGNTPGTYTLGSCGCPDTAVGWIAKKNVGLPASQVTVILVRDTINTEYTWGMPVTVEVQYPYQPILASFLNIPATINLKSKTTMHMQ